MHPLIAARRSGLIVSLIAFGVCLVGSSVIAQEKGDRVVVTANFDTKIQNASVGKVFEGGIYTITAVKGKWCSLGGVRGWLPLQYVMNLTMADRYFTKRIKDNPKDPFAYAHRGMILYERGKYERAFHDLNQSLMINRKNPVTWLNRGVVLKAQGKYQLAAVDFNEAIRLNPKLANAHYNLGLVLYALNNFEGALKAYDRAMQLNDKDPLWYISRGSARLSLNDVQGARQDYEHAIKLNRRLSDAYIGLSNLALMQDKYDEAFTLANKAVGIQPKNAMALNARGWIHYKQDKIDEAIFDLNRAIRYAPKLSLAYGNRGVCYVGKNEFDKAIADHSQHIKLDPRSAFAFANRAVAWLGKGNFKKAKADFEAAEVLAPELDVALNGYAWFLATCPDETFRDGKLALKKAETACKISEYKDWYQLDTLAAAHAELGQFDEAVKWAEKALAVAPQNKQAICEEQLARFKRKEPFRSQVGKNAEHGIIGS